MREVRADRLSTMESVEAGESLEFEGETITYKVIGK
jgi:hypothetical protein